MNRFVAFWMIIFLVSLVHLFGSCTAEGSPIQWNGNGHWYDAVYVGPNGINWTDARDAAVASGGYLATITSDAENSFVFSLVSTDEKFWFYGGTGCGDGPWLGGYQYDHLAESAGHWRWVTDEPWSYTNWGTGEPNGGTNEDYLSFFAYKQLIGSTWNDNPNVGYPPTDVPRGYIVEYNSIPEPSTIVLLGIGVVGVLGWSWRRRRKAG